MANLVIPNQWFDDYYPFTSEVVYTCIPNKSLRFNLQNDVVLKGTFPVQKYPKNYMLRGNVPFDQCHNNVVAYRVIPKIKTNPKNGTVQWIGERDEFLYTPKLGFVGRDYFSYYVSLMGKASNVSTVEIYVGSPPKYPSCNSTISSSVLQVLNKSVTGAFTVSLCKPTFDLLSLPIYFQLANIERQFDAFNKVEVVDPDTLDVSYKYEKDTADKIKVGRLFVSDGNVEPTTYKIITYERGTPTTSTSTTPALFASKYGVSIVTNLTTNESVTYYTDTVDKVKELKFDELNILDSSNEHWEEINGWLTDTHEFTVKFILTQKPLIKTWIVNDNPQSSSTEIQYKIDFSLLLTTNRHTLTCALLGNVQEFAVSLTPVDDITDILVPEQVFKIS